MKPGRMKRKGEGEKEAGKKGGGDEGGKERKINICISI